MIMNEQQLAAAEAPSGYVQIIAGPGTGKTVTMVGRVVTLINRGIDPNRIVAMTFTRSAAAELKSRIFKELQNRANGLIIGTFHSVGIRFLRKYGEFERLGIRLLGDHDALSICQEIEPKAPSRSLYLLFKKLKHITPDEQAYLCIKSKIPNVPELYIKFKERQQALGFYDFDEILEVFVDFLKASHQHTVDKDIDAVLIDEFQDTCATQLNMAMLMAGKCKNLTVVGDPNQSIYAFRGAVPQVFAKMRIDCSAKVWQMPLEISYRSTQSILTTAQRVLASNHLNDSRMYRDLSEEYSVIGPNLKSIVAKEVETPVEIVRPKNNFDETWLVARKIQELIELGVKPKDICVLSETSTCFAQYEPVFMSFQIKHRLVGGRQLLNTGNIIKFVDYIRVALNEADSLAISRTINQPSRKIGPKALDGLHKVCSNGSGLSFNKLRTSYVRGVSDYVTVVDNIRRHLDEKSVSGEFQTKENVRAAINYMSAKLFPEVNIDHLLMAIDVFDSEFTALNGDGNLTFAQFFVSIWALAPADSDAKSDGDQDNRVVCSTIHSAKGLEWPIVFLLYRPNTYAKKSPGELQRLNFVAVTRAKRFLAIVLDANEDAATLNVDPSYKIAQSFAKTDSAAIRCLESCLDYKLNSNKPPPSMITPRDHNKIDNAFGESLGFSTGLDLKWHEQKLGILPPEKKWVSANLRAPAKRSASSDTTKLTKTARKGQLTLDGFFK